jgi:hypothetical protein
MIKLITLFLTLSLSTYSFGGHCNSGHSDKKAEKKDETHSDHSHSHDHSHKSKSEEA